ncbi:hypothetical protein F53441_6454 [Fusarium austroafricanum]|uniref:Uncharacterized protein n=1 Tax=Fusarium austroafricanum TaxID=2364996 RepID=A0A8H4KHX0_9HYPO|nr:hypothetical protein F53441_6454 [Fusarium austroafricanum]
MPGFPFLELPRELQIQIVSYVIPPMTLPCGADEQYQRTMFSTGERSLLWLKLSCRSIYTITNFLREIDAIAVHQPKFYRSMNSESNSPNRTEDSIIFPPIQRAFRFAKKDMLRVWGMELPLAKDHRGGDVCLPIERLVSIWTEKQDQSPSMIFDTFETWPWYIPGFAFEERFRGDDDPPTNGILPGRTTNERWKFGTPGRIDQWPKLSTPLPPPRLLYYGHDMVLHDSEASGGYFSGFRYFEATREVWFSPISWPEVRDAITVPVADEPEEMWQLHNGIHAMFITRVWIIREGEVAPPNEQHHRWVEVKKYEDGDLRWVKRIEATWKVIWWTLEQQKQGNTPYMFRI